MKDLSFFLLRSTSGAKMKKKGFKNFCNGDGSTSTLNQQHKKDLGDSSVSNEADLLYYPYLESSTLQNTPPTLEEMILHLDMGQKMAGRAKVDEYGEMRRRMSCVNNADILRSARNALNQYPRFSLDGKDAMYRASFRNKDSVLRGGRKPFCCSFKNGLDSQVDKYGRLPTTLAGETVAWCKPGVVAKLMGLEAIPMPVNKNHEKQRLSSAIKKQNLRRVERHEAGRRRFVHRRDCSETGYCIMKPIAVELTNDEVGWPMGHFM